MSYTFEDLLREQHHYLKDNLRNMLLYELEEYVIGDNDLLDRAEQYEWVLSEEDILRMRDAQHDMIEELLNSIGL